MKNPILLLVYILYMQYCSAEQVSDDTLFSMSDHTKTTMGYDGTLICPTKKKFCALIYYIESDIEPYMLSSFDEDLKMVPLQCTHTGLLHHNAHVTMEGGDGIGQDYYEPQVTVYHDCWEGEKCGRCVNEIRRAQAYLRPVPIKESWKRQAWNMTLDPHRPPLGRLHTMEPLREYWFWQQKTKNKDLNEWIRGKEVFDREHLLKDDSLRFEKEIPHYRLRLVNGRGDKMFYDD